jgi:hypothetical protein
MKTPGRTHRLVTQFARPTRFMVRPRVLSRAEQRALLGELKERLLEEHLTGEDSPEARPRVRWAAEEAASLAWASPFPLLVLPELVKEKVAAARAQAERQARIWRQSTALLAEAA